jgi:hypothetical protein
VSAIAGLVALGSVLPNAAGGGNAGQTARSPRCGKSRRVWTLVHTTFTLRYTCRSTPDDPVMARMGVALIVQGHQPD